MTWHRRGPQARARDLAARRVRTITAATGLGAVAGAGALAVAVADADPPAWSATAAAVPAGAHDHVVAGKARAVHRPPHSLTSTKRRHHRRSLRLAAPAVRHRVQAPVTRAASPARVASRPAPPKPKPKATRATPAPSPTQSTTTSGGSHH